MTRFEQGREFIIREKLTGQQYLATEISVVPENTTRQILALGQEEYEGDSEPGMFILPEGDRIIGEWEVVGEA